MTINISIAEGGQGRNFSAEKIRTQKVGGGTCDWIPEESLGTLNIDRAGTYRATDYGFSGFSQVYVSASQQGEMDGTTTRDTYAVDPNTGERTPVTTSDLHVRYSRDPETGEITEELTPARIVIIDPPTKTEYNNLDPIDYTGIKVGVYASESEYVPCPVEGGTGTDNNILPMSALYFPISNAYIPLE